MQTTLDYGAKSDKDVTDGTVVATYQTTAGQWVKARLRRSDDGTMVSTSALTVCLICERAHGGLPCPRTKVTS